MQRGTVLPKGAVSYDGFQKVYETTLLASAPSVTISGLNGDVDVEYKVVLRAISAVDATAIVISPNNDTTTYGFQQISGSVADIIAGRSTAFTGFYAGYADANHLIQTDMVICAKTGFVRTALNNMLEDITGTTVTYVTLQGLSYDDTSTNITSLVFNADKTNSDGRLGIGTYIALYAKKART